MSVEASDGCYSKLRIADRGTYGTCILFKKKNEEEVIFVKHLTIKNCDKILFTNTEKISVKTDDVSTLKSRQYQVKNHSEGKMCNIN